MLFKGTAKRKETEMSSYLVSSTTALAAASAINDDPKCEDEKTLKIAGYLLYLNAEATASRYSEKRAS